MGQAVHGILLLDKPGGLTSNAALQRVRRLLGKPRAGHTGSLDPMATGLLPLCLGEATRVSGLLLDARKCYEAEARFGQRMDTGDATGQPVAEAPLPVIEPDSISRLLAAFEGPGEQVPPMYSAVRQQGRRLHELARAGQVVERVARPIHIHSLDIHRLDREGMAFRLECSKGTYVRVLIEDMARALGTEGHMTALRRTGVGSLRLDQAVGLDVLEQLSMEQRLAHVLPVEQALMHHPTLTLGEKQVRQLFHGQRFRLQGPRGQVLRAHGPDGRFLGLVELDEAGLLRVKRLFPHSAGLAGG